MTNRNLHFPRLLCAAALTSCVMLASLHVSRADDNSAITAHGVELYSAQCSSCHGDAGQGVMDKYEQPLYGDLPVSELAKLIDETMPEDNPSHCTGEDAKAVAEYMVSKFYTAEAREKNRPPREALSRLTVEQFDNSISDLLTPSVRGRRPDGQPGLKAEYYNSPSFKKDRKVEERLDSKVDFDYADGSPHPKADKKEFSIRWSGSVWVDETGNYEFTVASGNGFKLYLNDDQRMLIDGWVSSGGEPREMTETLRLLGGRAYRVRLEFFKQRDKTAAIKLLWKRPGQPREVIPRRNLHSGWASDVYVSKTRLPPDDASFGFPRGTAVSAEWDKAVTSTAIEASTWVHSRIDRLAGTKRDAKDRNDKIRHYCEAFVQRAFRRLLSDEEKGFYVRSHFADGVAIEESVKRSVILAIKSPRFLYPTPPGDNPDGSEVATRIALGLWDSLPDQRLLDKASHGESIQTDSIRREVAAATDDPRTRLKMRGFFETWLMLDRAEGMAKDTKLYPQFTPELVSDLRLSLDLFLDDIFWGDKPDYRRLMLSNTMFVNKRIADFYSVQYKPVDGSTDEDFTSIAIPNQPRAGVVTHPFLLSTLAYYKDTSPIHRGVFITRRLLGRMLNPPPVVTEFEESAFDPHLTMREKVAELTKASACQGCHHVINPLGFSLEHYDAVGLYRTTEKDKPIEAIVDYKSVEGNVIRLEGAHDLALHAAESAVAQKGFIRQLFEHLIKQPPAAFGPDTLADLHQQFVENKYNVRELVIDIVTVASKPRK